MEGSDTILKRNEDKNKSPNVMTSHVMQSINKLASNVSKMGIDKFFRYHFYRVNHPEPKTERIMKLRIHGVNTLNCIMPPNRHSRPYFLLILNRVTRLTKISRFSSFRD